MADALNQSRSPDGWTVHQLLHGYSGGHRLLAGSCTLPDELARITNRLSDLSGPRGPKGFEQYVTGYPLHAVDAYALAYTWYAPEMPRPGCVWTHTLLIPKGCLAEFPSLEPLFLLFRRPQLKGGTESYREPIPVQPAHMPGVPDLLAQAHFDRWKLAALLDAFYGRPEAPVVVPVIDSDEGLDFILALWSQQWPELRSQWSFSTGSLAPRTLLSQPFDLQFVPTGLTREMLREPGMKNRAVLVDYKMAPPRWSQIATEDASDHQGSAFRDFLWAVCEEGGGRASYAKYAQIFALPHDPSPVNAGERLVSLVASFFPLADDGARLKAAVLGTSRITPFQKTPTEIECLRALANTESPQAFSATALDLPLRGKLLWQTSPSEAQDFFSELLSRHLNPLAESIVSGILSGFDPSRAKDLAEQQPQLLSVLFAANPELATSPILWNSARSRQRELFDALARNARPEGELLTRIVFTMIGCGLDSVANTLFDRWGEPAVHAALDWAREQRFQISDGWFRALSAHPNEVLSWRSTSQPGSGETVVFLTRLLNPNSLIVRRFDATAWLAVLAEAKRTASAESLGRTYSFLLALSFDNPARSALKLISAAFAALHELLARQQLSYDDWLLVEHHTPDLGWLRHWDKCERLRRGLIASFVRYNWPPEALLKCDLSGHLFDDVVSSAFDVDGGKNFIKELRHRVKSGEVEASPGQRKALRIKD